MREEFEQYKKDIEADKIDHESWICIECREEFNYRPFSCHVICNDCLENKNIISVMGRRVEFIDEDEKEMGDV